MNHLFSFFKNLEKVDMDMKKIFAFMVAFSLMNLLLQTTFYGLKFTSFFLVKLANSLTFYLYMFFVTFLMISFFAREEMKMSLKVTCVMFSFLISFSFIDFFLFGGVSYNFFRLEMFFDNLFTFYGYGSRIGIGGLLQLFVLPVIIGSFTYYKRKDFLFSVFSAMIFFIIFNFSLTDVAARTIDLLGGINYYSMTGNQAIIWYIQSNILYSSVSLFLAVLIGWRMRIFKKTKIKDNINSVIITFSLILLGGLLSESFNFTLLFPALLSVFFSIEFSMLSDRLYKSNTRKNIFYPNKKKWKENKIFVFTTLFYALLFGFILNLRVFFLVFCFLLASYIYSINEYRVKNPYIKVWLILVLFSMAFSIGYFSQTF